MIEPLQEISLQANIEVYLSHADLKHILEASTKKSVERVSSQILEEVLEQVQAVRLLTAQAKEKVAQLAAPQPKEG